MELQLLIIKQNYILTSAIATWFYSHHQLYNCEDSKTLHELGAKLRIFSERRKEKGEKHDSWALQGKYSQMIINQTVTSCLSIKEAVFATLKVIVIQIKCLSLHSNINLELL